MRFSSTPEYTDKLAVGAHQGAIASRGLADNASRPCFVYTAGNPRLQRHGLALICLLIIRSHDHGVGAISQTRTTIGAYIELKSRGLGQVVCRLRLHRHARRGSHLIGAAASNRAVDVYLSR